MGGSVIKSKRKRNKQKVGGESETIKMTYNVGNANENLSQT